MGVKSWETVSDEQTEIEARLVENVIASFDECDDERLHQIAVSLVRHLHSFIRDVRLSPSEWSAAIDFLTRAGQISDDVRQEFVLLSDALGASMQTVNVANEILPGATEAAAFVPTFGQDSPEVGLGGDLSFGAPGEPCWVEGTVTDTEGNPLPGARIEVWEADAAGIEDVPEESGHGPARGHLVADQEGRYCFWSLVPTPYPIPTDGPVGAMLDAVGRLPWRAAHLDVVVSHEGQRTLATRIVPESDQVLWNDSAFGVKESLIRPFVRQDAGTPTPDGRALAGPWSRVQFDLVLAPATA